MPIEADPEALSPGRAAAHDGHGRLASFSPVWPLAVLATTVASLPIDCARTRCEVGPTFRLSVLRRPRPLIQLFYSFTAHSYYIYSPHILILLASASRIRVISHRTSLEPDQDVRVRYIYRGTEVGGSSHV